MFGVRVASRRERASACFPARIFAAALVRNGKLDTRPRIMWQGPFPRLRGWSLHGEPATACSPRQRILAWVVL